MECFPGYLKEIDPLRHVCLGHKHSISSNKIVDYASDAPYWNGQVFIDVPHSVV